MPRCFEPWRGRAPECPLPGADPETVDEQPDTVKVDGMVRVLSPFWSVTVALAVPVGVRQVVRNSP